MAAFVKATDAEVWDQRPASMALVASGAYTATATAEFSVPHHITVVEATIVATAKAATPGVTLSIEAFNPATGLWESLISGTQLTDVGTDTVQVNPYTPAVSNVSAQRVVRPKMRVKATHIDTDALTYSIAVFGS